MRFQDLHVVVTGGTGALGSAVVERLLADGAVCHLPNFHAAEMDNFPHADHPNVRVETGVDLTDEAAIAAFYETVPALWASINIAGGFAMAPIAETTQADALNMLTMNTLTCFLSCREAVKAIRARPASAADLQGGRIVNVAARPGVEPRTGSGMAAYAASKAAVAALTQALAEELAPEEIWVNAIAPSIIDTPANRSAMPKADHDKWPKPVAIAETIAFLAGPENATTRGAIVSVYGKS
jgi:NAD(P)-dependent dehydrogenase (short-subunit alcohol dehydrogenase family)